MALHEKRLKYKVQIVKLLKFEQYEPWFMRLNPKGQVPVLKDGVKIIPDSLRIIDYLEDNFSNGDTPRLWPEKGSEQAARVQHFREVLYSLSIDTITFGCMKFPELTKNTKIPGPIQKSMLASYAKKSDVLKEMAVKYPEFAEQYLHKQNRTWQRGNEQQSIEDVKKALDAVEPVLDEVERELEAQVGDKSEWFLCGDKFTVADISLAVLLNRLQLLGLSYRYWGEGKRPQVAAYFRHIQQRESVKATFNQVPTIITIWAVLQGKAPIIASVGAILAAILTGVIVYKCRK